MHSSSQLFTLLILSEYVLTTPFKLDQIGGGKKIGKGLANSLSVHLIFEQLALIIYSMSLGYSTCCVTLSTK